MDSMGWIKQFYYWSRCTYSIRSTSSKI